MKKELCVVFGATGFVGRALTTRLAGEGWHVRAVARRPAVPTGLPQAAKVEAVAADLCDAAAVRSVLTGATVAVNAVSLYHESGTARFCDVHVNAARTLAETARQQGLKMLILISGIGADPGSPSPYIAARGLGEQAFRDAFPETVIIRPSAIFSPGDSFLSTLMRIVAKAPLCPLFGDGGTRIQPVYLGDVAAATARITGAAGEVGLTYELGGPEILTYRELLETLSRHVGRRPLFVPVPFWVWDLLARATAILERPPVTEGMVALMRRDNVASSDTPGFRDLELQSRPIKAALPDYLDL